MLEVVNENLVHIAIQAVTAWLRFSGIFDRHIQLIVKNFLPSTKEKVATR